MVLILDFPVKIPVDGFHSDDVLEITKREANVVGGTRITRMVFLRNLLNYHSYILGPVYRVTDAEGEVPVSIDRKLVTTFGPVVHHYFFCSLSAH